MHEPFVAFIQHGKTLAEAKGLAWDFPIDADGSSNLGWNFIVAPEFQAVN